MFLSLCCIITTDNGDKVMLLLQLFCCLFMANKLCELNKRSTENNVKVEAHDQRKIQLCAG